MAADGHGGCAACPSGRSRAGPAGSGSPTPRLLRGDLTRRCVEGYLTRGKPYDGHGLLAPRNFVVDNPPHEPLTNCINVARWPTRQRLGDAGADMDKNCFRTKEVPYKA